MFWDKKMETLPKSELERLQMKRLRWTLNHVYRNSPFYRKRFKEHGITPDDIKKREDIAKLPFTRKS
ncbi:MAG: phenylacetate-CoA ligase, partial [Archaeoglobi archaeon]|nr:phenylacetate-CoA ligase [Archaeoglobi archaeon]